MKSAWITVGSIALIIFLGLGAAWMYVNRKTGPSSVYPYSNTETANFVLTQQNADFAEAQRLMDAEKYSEARVLYAKALEGAQDDIQASQIKFKIAMADYLSGDMLRAIDELKLLVADPYASNFVKAYAVLHTGRMYYLTHNPAIDAKIFENEPYASFKNGKTFKESYIELYKYGSSFYPLALSELYIADFYAEQLLGDFANTIQLTAEEKNEYITIVNEKLENAERDIVRTQADHDAKILVPPALEIRANVIGRLWGIGKATEDQVRDAYQRAFDAYATIGRVGQDGFTRIWYSIFLLTTEEKANQPAEIKKILSPLYTNPGYSNARVVTFLKARQNQDPIVLESLKVLARLDPDFKKYLMGLGWQEADFKILPR